MRIKRLFLVTIIALAMVLALFSISAQAQGLYGIPNPNFDGGAWGWMFTGSLTTYDTSYYHTAPRSAKMRNAGGVIQSSPFLASGPWGFWASDNDVDYNGRMIVQLRDFTAGNIYIVNANLEINNTGGGWGTFDFTFPATMTNHLVEIVLTLHPSSEAWWYVDDFYCVQCLTPGFPYGLGTPIPVSVTFPTPPPYPTFPAWPTIGWPTPNWSGFPTIQPSISTTNITNNETNDNRIINEGGTVNNTIYLSGSMTISGSFPYGKDTPIPIYQPTRVRTVAAVPTNAGTAGGLGVAAPVYVSQIDARNVSGVIPLYVGGSAPAVVRDGVVLKEYSGSLCLPSQFDDILTGIDKCFAYHYSVITEWYILRINVLPAMAGIYGLIVLLIIWSQIRRR